MGPAALKLSLTACGQLRAAVAGAQVMLWLSHLLHLGLCATARSWKEPHMIVCVSSWQLGLGLTGSKAVSLFLWQSACETQDDTAVETGRKFPSQRRTPCGP